MATKVVIRWKDIDKIDSRLLTYFFFYVKAYASYISETKREFEEPLKELETLSESRIDIEKLINKLRKYNSFTDIIDNEYCLLSYFRKNSELIYIEDIHKGSWKYVISTCIGVSIFLLCIAATYKVMKSKSGELKIKTPAIEVYVKWDDK
jgi:hypothetical protein